MYHKRLILFLFGGLSAFFVFYPALRPVLAVPQFSEVSSQISTSSVKVIWTVTDDKEIRNAGIETGPSEAYGQTSTYFAIPGNVSGTKYYFASTIYGTKPGQTIYYRLEAVNAGGEKNYYKDSFSVPFPDTTAPRILSFSAVPQSESATISWKTDEEASGSVEYRPKGGDWGLKNDANFSKEHHIYIGSLTAGATYEYRISIRDRSGNLRDGELATFSLKKEVSAPVDVDGFLVRGEAGGAQAVWVVPPENFEKVKLTRSEILPSGGSGPVALIYEGDKAGFLDKEVEKTKKYIYTIYTLGPTGLSSGGLSVEFDGKNLPAEEKIATTTVAATTTAEDENAIAQAAKTATAIKEFTENEGVQKAVSNVVAPTIVGVSAVSAISILTWVNILPFLQLLLQPLTFLGLRKKSSTGIVYNSLSKIPIDLATVRLVNRETGQIVQSKVTDKEGRYVFVINPGLYKIQVLKNNFVFPTEILKDLKDDGRMADIYHGGTLEASASNAVIAVNIPLDPVGDYDLPIVKLWWQKILSSVRSYLAWFGLVIIVVSLFISPRWYTALLLPVQIFILAMVRHVTGRQRAKSWGVVTDANSGQPIPQVIVRLFNSGLNKLVATQVTDSRGRYYFLAAEGKYYLTLEHPSYVQKKTGIVDLRGMKAETISLDIELQPVAKS